MMYRYCKVCGAKFELAPHCGNKKYCSSKCSHAALLKRERDRVRNAYWANHKNRDPQKLVCVKCGNIFYGHGCAKYCDSCLNDGTWYMSKLRNNRSVRR